MKIFQVDAFASQLFQGNPAAVVPMDHWLPDEVMGQIAMENNLAETAFFVPQREGWLIRWFTPTIEVALCGHATLASAFVIWNCLGYTRNNIVFHTRHSGDLHVTRTRDNALILDFPATPAVPVDPVPAIFEGLGVPARQLFKGPYDYLVVVDDQRTLESLRPDFSKLATVEARGIVVTAPGRGVDFVSRCFFPQSGINEDPVTGSAHTMLTPYWAARLAKPSLSAIQLSARGGNLLCEQKADRVLITGQAKLYLQGEIFIEPPANAGLGLHQTDAFSAADVTLREAQVKVDHWIRTVGVRYFSELTNLAVLAEEVGEVARLMSRLYGDQSFKKSDEGKNLPDELADVLWVLICIANQTGVDLTAALDKNFAKKQERDGGRHRENSKLNAG